MAQKQKQRQQSKTAKTWRTLALRLVVVLMLCVTVLQLPAMAASTRLEDRGLKMESARKGDITTYTLSFRYMSEQPVGSIDLVFCTTPIPYLPCHPPSGMDVGGAVLSDQTGETGFAITTQTSNHIVLSRPPSTIAPGEMSTYVFTGVKNPTNVDAFAIRIQVYDQPGATGEKGDFGGVRGSVTEEIVIQTQVPPMLIFCLAQQVQLECTGSNGVYHTELGELRPDETLMAQSEMAVGTNATAGFAITVEGIPLAAGTSVIDAMAEPGPSQPGTNQFGINLVENTEPMVGADPTGPWTNAMPTDDYGVPDMFKFRSGDVVASSPSVSLMRKFTASYIINSREDLRPGIYATTITFIASGRF